MQKIYPGEIYQSDEDTMNPSSKAEKRRHNSFRMKNDVSH